MKIYDCFMFFDEEMLLDLRLNVLNEYVDKFVITEATYSHNGDPKKLNFDIKKFEKFKDKIEYIVVKDPPPDLFVINKNDNEDARGEKLILNGMKRDYFQRQELEKGLLDAEPNDLIIISDLDEIPNLENIEIKKIKSKIICFKQRMFYYKFNLLYESFPWFGTRICKKKNLISPQWLRDTKHKKYPLWRLDILFSKYKYHDITYVENGGWHFTNIKSPEKILQKLTKFAHHYEFETSGLKINDLEKIVKEKKVVYDHSVDQRGYKWSATTKLKKLDLSEMPKYLANNNLKYKDWLD
jgi:beta-1,4-mannosyl-glycoprotein beta-1,4-N-acetylglucosaminyltransferase